MNKQTSITEILVLAASRAELSVLLKDAGINPATTGWRYISSLADLEKYAAVGNPILISDRENARPLSADLQQTMVMRLASGRLRFCTDADIQKLIQSRRDDNVTLLPARLKDWPMIKMLAADVLHATGRFNQRDISAALSVSYSDAGDILAALDKAAQDGTL